MMDILDWKAVAAFFAILSVMGTGINLFVGLSVRAAIAEFRAEIERSRREDQTALKAWAEERFALKPQIRHQHGD